MKHKIEDIHGHIIVKEKRTILSKWLFVDSQGEETHEDINIDCIVENEDHAQRVIDYRLKFCSGGK